MVGSTVEENVVERQNEEKLMTSRTSTPASAGRSRRPSRRRRGRARAVMRLLRVRATAQPSRSKRSVWSCDFLAGQEDEDVLEVRGAALAVGRAAVGGVVEAQDRDRRAGAAGAHPAG